MITIVKEGTLTRMKTNFYIFDIVRNESGNITKMLIGDCPEIDKCQKAWWHSKSVAVALAEGYTFTKVNGNKETVPNIRLKLFLEDNNNGNEDLGIMTFIKTESIKNILEDF